MNGLVDEKLSLQGKFDIWVQFLHLFNRFKEITGDTYEYDYSYNPCYGYGFVDAQGCNGANNAVSLNHNVLSETIGIKC